MGDSEMLVDMGFSPVAVKKAMKATRNAGLQPALDWLEKHGDDKDLNDPVAEQLPSNADDDEDESAGGGEANSLRCVDCGKQLRNSDAAQMHAVKTGHANFEQSTEEVKPLTEEEKKAKLEELRVKMAAKRQEKAELEKEEEKQKEKMRRVNGQDLVRIKEELAEREMKQALEQKKREKREEMEARARIKAQIEEDKRARAEKFDQEKRMRAGLSQESTPPPAAQATAAKIESGNYAQTRIQIRAAGRPSPLTQAFAVDDPLQKLIDHLEKAGFPAGTYSLSMTYPKRVIDCSESGAEKTFKQLDLVPSAAVVLSNK
eukprot:Partr_v1_DN24819_c0_g1_i1_m29532 putative UBX domain protein